MSLRTLLMTMLLLMPVVPMVSAGTECVPAVVAVGCVTAEPVSEEGCEPEPMGSECYTAEGHQAGASVDTVGGGVAAQAAHVHVTETFHSEAGACTSIDLRTERDHLSASASGEALVGGGAAGAGAGRGNGTLVYEDPCGEGLIADLEPGTYEVRFLYAGGHVALFLPVGVLIAIVSAQDVSFEDEEGGNASCERGMRGFILFDAPTAPPVVLTPATGDTC